MPEGLEADGQSEKTILTLVNDLASAGRSLAELRNRFGTGHGNVAGHAGLGMAHARLAVGASTTVAVFLYEVHRTA